MITIRRYHNGLLTSKIAFLVIKLMSTLLDLILILIFRMQLKIVGRGPMREYVSCVHEMNGNDSSSNLYSFLMC